MSLDLRVPIGSLFALLGLLLAGYGLVSDPAIYQASLGINVNLWWGLVLVLFGGFMLGTAWLAARKRGAQPPDSSRTEPTPSRGARRSRGTGTNPRSTPAR
jgi:drug/metabolite transporter (DMT)-like permease